MSKSKSESEVEVEVDYGDTIVGSWNCIKCKLEYFPIELLKKKDTPPFKCPKCQSELIYDEME